MVSGQTGLWPKQRLQWLEWLAGFGASLLTSDIVRTITRSIADASFEVFLDALADVLRFSMDCNEQQQYRTVPLLTLYNGWGCNAGVLGEVGHAFLL